MIFSIHFLKSKLFLGLELLILIFVVFSLVKISIKNNSIETEVADIANEIEDVKQENQVLVRQLKTVVLDSYSELQAKRSLNYQGPEEMVLVFYDQVIEQPNAGALLTATGEEAEVSNPVKWWRYFFR